MSATTPDYHTALSSRPEHLPPPPTAASPNAQEHHFSVHWTDPTGHVWEGEFVSVIPSISQELEIGRRVARLLGDLRADQVDNDTRALMQAIARISVVLKRKPEWANDLGKMVYDEPIGLIYKEVSEHAARFRGQRQSA